jgi:CYTH domain-containing protein
VLAAALDGMRISKIRHRLRSPPGVALALDEFQGENAGLLIAEAEFDSDDLMRDFAAPDFALREVTGDLRFTGPYLARYGRAADPG